MAEAVTTAAWCSWLTEQHAAVDILMLLICRSYFAIFGNLFGFKNFGKLVAADNIFNSLFGLLQVRRWLCFTGAWGLSSLEPCLPSCCLLPRCAVPADKPGPSQRLHCHQHRPSCGPPAAVPVCLLHVPLGELRSGADPVCQPSAGWDCIAFWVQWFWALAFAFGCNGSGHWQAAMAAIKDGRDARPPPRTPAQSRRPLEGEELEER